MENFLENSNESFSQARENHRLSLDKMAAIFSTISDLTAVDGLSMVKALLAFEQGDGLQKWLHTVLEIAGAQKGLLIMERDGSLFVEVEATVNSTESLKSVPLEFFRNVAHSVIQSVRKTKRHIILSNGAQEGVFSRDPYFRENDVKSVFALPVLKDSKLIGILYLENNILADAFTLERLEILRAMSIPACITLENMRLAQEIKQVEKNLRSTKEHWHSLLEHATEGIALFDDSYGLLWLTEQGISKISGTQLAKTIKREMPEIPVFFLNNSENPLTENLPGVFVIAKPFSLNELESALVQATSQASK